MTVRADIFRNLLEAARPFYACVFNDNGDVSVSTGHITIDNWLRLDRAFHAASEPAALASPRADSDERTAGEVSDEMVQAAYDHWISRSDPKVFDGVAAHKEWLKGIVAAAMASATPAQPAGAVPDSLRALSEAASQGEWSIWREPILSAEEAVRELTLQVEQTSPLASHLYLLNASGKCPATTGCGPTSQANANFIVAAVNFVRSLIASHPAGQSAGSGADADLAALAEAASVPERAYGILWRLTAFDTGQIGYAHDARKVLLAAMDKEGQRRGIAWATRQYGPLGPNPRFMLSDEDRMEMGL